MLFDIEHFRKFNNKLLDQIRSYFPSYEFVQTTHSFDLKYHADLKVKLPNNEIEYWLMRFRKPPYRDFALRVRACKYPSEYEKIYNGQTLSKRYLHLVLDESDDVSEIFVINLERLRQNKSFLNLIYHTQKVKNEFIYITPQQLFSLNCIDFYIRTK